VRSLYFALAFPALLFFQAQLNGSQEQPNGPTSLVISYRAKPELRAKFLEYMETSGVAQFEKWKQAAVYRDYQILYSAYAAGSAWDLAVILNFDHYSDTERWQEIEKHWPGGLSPEALAMAAPQSSTLADLVAHADGKRDTSKAVYMLLRYEVLVDAGRYLKYVDGYVAPQFKGWLREGALTGYWIYVPQNPGGPWSAFMVLEYADSQALGRREVVKNKVRAELAAGDPVWKAFSDDKTAVRKELEASVYRAIRH